LKSLVGSLKNKTASKLSGSAINERTKAKRKTLAHLPTGTADSRHSSRAHLLAPRRTSLPGSILRSRTSLANRETPAASESSGLEASSSGSAMDWSVPQSPATPLSPTPSSPFRHSTRPRKPSPKALENTSSIRKRLNSRLVNSLGINSSTKRKNGVLRASNTASNKPAPAKRVAKKQSFATEPMPVAESLGKRKARDEGEAVTPAGRLSKRVSKPSPKMRDIQAGL
jgi:hypothetical protein